MEDQVLTVIKNVSLTDNVNEMVLKTKKQLIDKPGQFMEIKLEQFFLRRPISICDVSDSTYTIIYKVVGKGTEVMSQLETGSKLNCLVPLGNGFDTTCMKEDVVLVGGGVGVPPLYYLAKQLIQEGKKPKVILGFNTKDEIFYEQQFKDLGLEVYVTTVDGTYGTKGFVTSLLKGTDTVATCGPLPMLKAIKNVVKDGQYSLEARMGCGFGACMGCSIETSHGSRRVCKDGPIFKQEELLW